MLPGLWPALAAARVDVLRVLGSQGGNSAGGRPSPLRRWLVGAQIAGLDRVPGHRRAARPVVRPHSSSRPTASIAISWWSPSSSRRRTATTRTRAERYVDALLARVRALPGVTDAAVIDRAPFFIGFERLTPVWPDGGACEADACPKIATLAAGPGLFPDDGHFDGGGPRIRAGARRGAKS